MNRAFQKIEAGLKEAIVHAQIRNLLKPYEDCVKEPIPEDMQALLDKLK